MNLNLQFFILSMFIFKSNGHTVPVLGDIISGAQGVLNGITHNFNIGGHLGLNLNRKENKVPPKQPETIVVVIKEEDNRYDQSANGYMPNQNGFKPPQHYHNNGYNPDYNQHSPNHHRPGRPNEHFGHHHDAQPSHGHKPGRPFNNNNNEYNNGNYDSYEAHDAQRPRPNGYPTYQHQNEFERPDNPTQGNGNYGYNNKGQGNYYNHGQGNHYDMRPNIGNSNGNPDRPNQGDNYPFKPTRPNQGFNNFDQHHNSEHNNNFSSQNSENNNQGIESSTGQFQEITSEYTKEPVSKNTEKPNKVTKEPKDDVPFFVPLDVSGADSTPDKTSDKTPKRETDENKDEDEDFDIDIRIKNE